MWIFVIIFALFPDYFCLWKEFQVSELREAHKLQEFMDWNSHRFLSLFCYFPRLVSVFSLPQKNHGRFPLIMNNIHQILCQQCLRVIETQYFLMDISHYFRIGMSPRFYLFFYYPKIRPKAPMFPLPGITTFIGENTASTRVGQGSNKQPSFPLAF